MKPTTLRLVNPHPRYARPEAGPQTGLGYIHVAAETDPEGRPALEARLPDAVERVRHEEHVVGVSVLRALTIPPFDTPYLREHADAVRPARFDLVVLVEAVSPEAAQSLRRGPAVGGLVDLLAGCARQQHVMVARNAWRGPDTVDAGEHVYFFQYFVGDDPAVTLALWEHVAAWYQVELGLYHSTLLAPLDREPSDYHAVNRVRLKGGLPRFLERELAAQGYSEYLIANLEANHVGAMPVPYRLVDC